MFTSHEAQLHLCIRPLTAVTMSIRCFHYNEEKNPKHELANNSKTVFFFKLVSLLITMRSREVILSILVALFVVNYEVVAQNFRLVHKKKSRNVGEETRQGWNSFYLELNRSHNHHSYHFTQPAFVLLFKLYILKICFFCWHVITKYYVLLSNPDKSTTTFANCNTTDTIRILIWVLQLRHHILNIYYL